MQGLVFAWLMSGGRGWTGFLVHRGTVGGAEPLFGFLVCVRQVVKGLTGLYCHATAHASRKKQENYRKQYRDGHVSYNWGEKHFGQS